MKICIKGFSKSLITNPVSEFEKSKWRIQYGSYFRLELRFSMSTSFVPGHAERRELERFFVESAIFDPIQSMRV